MDLDGLSASALSAAIGRGDVTCRAVMAATLDRIDAVNPRLNAIVALRDREVLMAEAGAADTGPRKGWLHGVPMAIKDLAATRDAGRPGARRCSRGSARRRTTCWCAG